jgi:hypothetical protein
MAYYDGDAALVGLAEKSAYADLLLAARFAKERNRSAVEKTMARLKREDLLPPGVKDYDRVAALELHPFCEREKLAHCLSVTQDMTEKIKRPWL